MRLETSSLARTGTVQVLLCALCALGILFFGGCGRSWPAPQTWTPRHEGTVYVARLITEHPLYPQYQRLGEEIASLRRGCSVPQVRPVFLELGELFLPPPDPPVFPLREFEARHSQWQLTMLPDRPVTVATLEPDLQAELSWARAQAQQEAATQIEQMQAQQAACVAQVRAEAVKERQEAMSNAGLDMGIAEKDVPAAQDREQQRLRAEVEQAVAAAQVAADQRVSQGRQQIEEQMRGKIAAAEARISARMKRRTEIFVKSGSEMRTRLSKALVPPEPLAMGTGLLWRPKAEVAAAKGPEPAVTAMLQREQTLRGAQAAVLVARRADMAADLERGTELAVRRIAGLRGIRVHFPPTEAPAGADLTEQFRAGLRQMFKY